MLKRKKQPKQSPSLTLSKYLESYDYKTLHAALNGVQDSFAWDLLKSYLRQRQREFEVAALDLAGHTGRSQEAAKASGYAQGMEDAAETLIPEFIRLVLGQSQLVENPRPEEAVQ